MNGHEVFFPGCNEVSKADTSARSCSTSRSGGAVTPEIAGVATSFNDLVGQLSEFFDAYCVSCRG